MSQNVVNALLNFILVGIPEELFLTIIMLILMKRFDLIDIRIWKQNIKWLAIPVLPVALMINIFRYILMIPKPLMTIIDLILFFVLMVYVLKKNSFDFCKKEYKDLIISFALSFMLLGLLESLTVPIVLFLTNKPLEYFNNNAILNFILSIPSRMIEIFIIILLIIKCNNTIKIKVLDSIVRSKFLLTSIVIFSISFNIISVYVIKLITVNKILDGNVSGLEQVFISIGILLIPSSIIFWMLLAIGKFLTVEKRMQQTYNNLFEKDNVMFDVEDKIERSDKE